MDTTIRDIGRRIRKYRRAADLTQADLAEKLGYTSRTSIGKIESGDAEMPISKLIRCADILDVDVIVLLFGEEK